jgi:phosphoribosylformimino-5-aminoimidazole carboxamide ribotide isomerase
VVRLVRGDFARITRYAIDPVEYARELRDRAPLLHVIDLDAARGGRLVQVRLIREVCDAFGGPVQVGGGVRGPEDIAALRDAGAARVIVGTAAARDPALVRGLASAHPDALVVALDTRGGRIAVEGWQATTALEPEAIVASLRAAPLAALIHTDIARDGTLGGPALASLAALGRQSPWPVLAAGGVASMDDVCALADLSGVAGVIVGRALLDGAVTLTR